jgi:hypothetical protein
MLDYARLATSLVVAVIRPGRLVADTGEPRFAS